MEQDFKWTDELAQQFAREWRGSSGRTSIDSFKQSNTPKPQESTSVKYFSGMVQTVCEKHDFVYVCYTDNFKTHKYEQCRNCGASKPKEQPPQRIEVRNIVIGAIGGTGYIGVDGKQIPERNEYSFYYNIEVSTSIPKEKLPLIKQTIENCLNHPEVPYNWQFNYTQQQVDELCEKAFNAARCLDFGGRITGYMGRGIKYPTFQDYKNSKQ